MSSSPTRRRGVTASLTRRRGVYPGSFNPLTRAHLAIAEAARQQRHLDVVVLCVSNVALVKEAVDRPRFADRLDVLRRDIDRVEGIELMVTDRQLLADIATGFDVLVMGADKWVQIHELRFYGDDASLRDAALASLPELAIAPRPPHQVPEPHLLRIPAEHAVVSSTSARAGARALMAPEARRFDDRTGAWTDPDRYDDWVRRHGP